MAFFGIDCFGGEIMAFFGIYCFEKEIMAFFREGCKSLLLSLTGAVNISCFPFWGTGLSLFQHNCMSQKFLNFDDGGDGETFQLVRAEN